MHYSRTRAAERVVERAIGVSRFFTFAGTPMYTRRNVRISALNSSTTFLDRGASHGTRENIIRRVS